MRIAALFLVLSSVACGGGGEKEWTLMTASDALALPQPEPDHRLSYGDHPLQFGELRLPDGPGLSPVVIVIHGGCWSADYDLGYISALAEAITESGAATWSIEYRRVGDDGGGWPGTFQDVADAADHLHEIAVKYNLDLDRVGAVGHSAGGHLALWLAGREWLDGDDPLRGDVPVSLNGVVALAGIADLEAYVSEEGCGSFVSGLVGGDSAEYSERLQRASPVNLVPFGIDVAMVIGDLDDIVPASQANEFAVAAREMGDEVEVIAIPNTGHFELIDPVKPAFGIIRVKAMQATAPAFTE
jgi:acetyl esterase/lipase